MARLPALVLAAALTVCFSLPAMAACYGPAQIRQMVAQGQAIDLSSVLPQIKAIGKPLSLPPLCDDNGGLAYQVDVMRDGAVVHLRIDAHSGAISQ